MQYQGASRPTGRPATALGARASRLQSYRFHRLDHLGNGDGSNQGPAQEFLSVPFACMAKDGHGPMRFYGATGGRDGEDVLLRNVSTIADFHKHVFHSLASSKREPH